MVIDKKMLEALDSRIVMPIHRHMGASETMVCIRGHFEECFYDENCDLTETIDVVPAGL